MKFRLFSFFLISIASSQATFGQKAVPELWGVRVHDDAKILSAGTAASLENQLKVFEDSTSNQIAILTVSSLDGDPIEEYALRVAEKWKLGQEKKDNGVLLVIAKDDRKMRIEVGQGLEGPLPDAICNRIVRNEMAPRFREGDFDGGVQAAITAIMQAIKGEYVSDESDVNVYNSSDGPNWFIAAIFLFVIGSLTWNSLFSKGGVSWFMYIFQIPFYYFFPPLGFGTTIGNGIFWGFLIAFPILRLLIQSTPWGRAMIKKMEENQKKNRSRGGGWSSGSGWYGGGGGWSSGGGSSWGGGGGSFGGGGSSGSW